MSAGSINVSSIAQGITSLNPQVGSLDQSSKATQYIDLLYKAKCDGQWNSVPELVRKVEKHAPSRKCLALAAKTAARIYPNPSIKSFIAADKDLAQPLAEAIQNERTHAADLFDAVTCYAALLFGVGKTQEVLTQIPLPLHRIAVPSEGQGQVAWLAIGVMQGTLVFGLAQEALGQHANAENTYRSIISYVAHVVALPNPCTELRRWTEELLFRICLFFSKDVADGTSHLGEAMAAFHILSKYLEKQSWRPLWPSGTFIPYSPKNIWRAYYETLSKVIREELVYHPSPIYRDHNSLEHRGLLDDDDFKASRSQQRADLRRVETNYESLLLKETTFPRANETNQEVSSWVELVMANWQMLCGPNWTNRELDSGGKSAVARNTLDILYRAAMKTFHSTQLLRHLFTVHVFLAEFDIAFKAFDTYIGIMNKGKARAARSGQAGITLDDDDTAIRLASEAIDVACKFGSESAAEKALAIGETLLDWIHESNSASNNEPNLSKLSPECLSMAYRAIGISQAQFARFSPLPSSRAEFQSKAIENLGHSLKQGLDRASYVESFFALSLVFSEMRDIPNAIQTIKQAIQLPEDSSNPRGENQPNQTTQTAPSNRDSHDKSLRQIPAWHLLVQLLCAQEEFELAQKSCSLAFERVGGLSNLLPQVELLKSTQNGTSNQQGAATVARIDAMSAIDKESLLELKMTQLSLIEVNEGVDVAVNRANELLALFSNLVGITDFKSSKKFQGVTMLAPPKSSSGTIRSVFGRPKSLRRTMLADNYQSGVPSKTVSAANSRPQTGVPSKTVSAVTSRPQSGIPSKSASAMPSRPVTRAPSPPAVQVTGSNGSPASPEGTDDQSEKPKPNTLKKKSSSIRRAEPTDNQPLEEASEKALSAHEATPGGVRPRVSFYQEKDIQEETEPAVSPLPLGNVSANIEPRKKPAPLGQVAQPPIQDTRLPVPHPKDQMSSLPPLFIELQEKRQKTSLLTKIWLFIARLYCNLSLLTDAKEAVQEARKLVSSLEADISSEKASVSQFQERGWGGGRSVEELWADVYAEEGKILQSQSLPHDAILSFEKALSHHPDHLEATISLSGILLDIYDQEIPLEKIDASTDLLSLALVSPIIPKAGQLNDTNNSDHSTEASNVGNPDSSTELSRLASRDRAYGLLSSITKLGIGWDSPEAWFTLSRAYEMSGQVDKAKEALWWTVRLEDTKPIRHWRNINHGGYVL